MDTSNTTGTSDFAGSNNADDALYPGSVGAKSAQHKSAVTGNTHTGVDKDVLGSHRPLRAKEKVSYSDFYNLGTEKKATVPTDVPNEDQANVLKFRFRANSKVSGRPQEAAQATNSTHGGVMKDEGLAAKNDKQQSPSFVFNNEEEMVQGPQAMESRSRVMTSPLSSVPSDLDDYDNAYIDHEIVFEPNRNNGTAYHLPDEYITPRSEADTSHLPGRKRAALSSDVLRGHEKKNKLSKKIKISSPAKQKKSSGVELGVLPQDLKARVRPELDARMRIRDDDQGSNDGHCSACQGTGKLLCCDDCPKSFHFTCIEPPIEEADIPDEPFFCMSCWDKRYGFPRPDEGLFYELFSNEITRDPFMFQLPPTIRNYFENVSTGDLGVYQEATDQKILRKDRHGFAEEQDPFRLRDRQNRPILCYKCGESALGTAGIISCDHCTAHWHFDCVDPPMHGWPTNYRKWMCPLHAGDITPKIRRPRQSRLLDVSLSRGFKNDGNIDVDLADDEHASESESDCEEEDRSSWAPAMADIPRVKYRLPSKGIILDFLDTCHQDKDEEGVKITNALHISSSQDLKALIEIVLQEVRSLERPEASAEKEERIQLLALKSLIARKGKEKLMAFLTTET